VIDHFNGVKGGKIAGKKLNIVPIDVGIITKVITKK
jgi:hypothetical protein